MEEISKKINNKTPNKLGVARVVLLLLFISSIALISFKYKEYVKSPLDFFSYGESRGDISSKNILTPMHLIIGFSSDNATVVESGKEEMVEEGVTALRASILQGDIERVKKEEYEDVLSSQHMTFLYNNIPAKSIESGLNLVDTFLKQQDEVQSITFAMKDFECYDIYMSSNEEIFKIKNSIPSQMEGAKRLRNSDYAAYYPILNFVTNKGSQVLIPLNPTYKLAVFYSSSKLAGRDMETIATNIFRDKLDFTSHIKQGDGTSLYSYNNGSDVVSISPDGVLRYKEEPGLARQSRDSSDAVITALTFLDNISDSKNYMITSVDKIDGQRDSSYRIELAKVFEEIPFITFKANEREYITVQNGKIVDSMVFVAPISIEPKVMPKTILNPLSVLDMQTKTLLPALSYKDSRSLLESIEDIKLIYFHDLISGDITPAWYFKTNDSFFVIDCLDGSLLSYGYI